MQNLCGKIIQTARSCLHMSRRVCTPSITTLSIPDETAKTLSRSTIGPRAMYDVTCLGQLLFQLRSASRRRYLPIDYQLCYLQFYVLATGAAALSSRGYENSMKPKHRIDTLLTAIVPEYANHHCPLGDPRMLRKFRPPLRLPKSIQSVWNPSRYTRRPDFLRLRMFHCRLHRRKHISPGAIYSRLLRNYPLLRHGHNCKTSYLRMIVTCVNSSTLRRNFASHQRRITPPMTHHRILRTYMTDRQPKHWGVASSLLELACFAHMPG